MFLIKQIKNQNKYKNIKTKIDNISFDSKKEAKRYEELKLLQKNNVIKDLQLQKKFILQEKFILDFKTYREISYIADFYYYDNEKQKYIIEDVKASKYFQDDVYKLKKKLLLNKYIVFNDNIEFKEII